MSKRRDRHKAEKRADRRNQIPGTLHGPDSEQVQPELEILPGNPALDALVAKFHEQDAAAEITRMTEGWDD